MEALIASGDVRFVYKHFVIHPPRVQWAAEAVECAGDQGKWWAYHDQLYANPREWSKADLSEIAKQIGLDTKQFQQCFDSGKHTDAVNKQTAEAKAGGVKGTPTIFLNGKQVELSVAFARLGELAREELAKQ